MVLKIRQWGYVSFKGSVRVPRFFRGNDFLLSMLMRHYEKSYITVLHSDSKQASQLYRRLRAVDSRKINIASFCVACCSLLCKKRKLLLHHSYLMWPKYSSQYRKKAPLEILQFIQKYNLGNSVPNIVIMLRIFVTIAVSVATCEGSFPKLKLIKNYLRSRMSTLRLKSLTTLSIEQQFTDKINFDIAIEEFAKKKARKVSVQKIVVFVSETKMVLIFYTFYYFSLYVIFCFLFKCCLECLSFGVYTIFEHVRAL